MTPIVDLDTGQVPTIVDGRGSVGVGDRLSPVPRYGGPERGPRRIDPSTALGKALCLWLPQTAVDAFHLLCLATQAVTEARQRLPQEIRGRGGRTGDPGRANRRLLLRAGETGSDRGRKRLRDVLGHDGPTGQVQAAWEAKEQLRTLPAPGSLEDTDDRLRIPEGLVGATPTPETKRLLRTMKRRWNEIEVPVATGATTAKVEANNTAIRNIKRTGRGFHNPENYRSRILLRSTAQTAA